VRDGRIKVKRDTRIDRLTSDAAKLTAHFSDGTSQPADIVLTGTGFHQRIPFLEPEVVRKFTDSEGNFLLYRSLQPLEVENLYFNGYKCVCARQHPGQT
jgi:hypothetical protein